MKRYFAPLWIFVSGQILLLFVIIFLPAIGNQATQLAANTTAIANTFWLWSEIVPATKLLVVLFMEALILIAAGTSFLAIKD